MDIAAPIAGQGEAQETAHNRGRRRRRARGHHGRAREAQTRRAFVDRSLVWVETVKRGPMVRQVHGPGTLVPVDIRWIAARTQGRVERIVLLPGAPVEPDSVILVLSNPTSPRRPSTRRRSSRPARPSSPT
jgi:hypothetical protein